MAPPRVYLSPRPSMGAWDCWLFSWLRQYAKLAQESNLFSAATAIQQHGPKVTTVTSVRGFDGFLLTMNAQLQFFFLVWLVGWSPARYGRTGNRGRGPPALSPAPGTVVGAALAMDAAHRISFDEALAMYDFAARHRTQPTWVPASPQAPAPVGGEFGPSASRGVTIPQPTPPLQPANRPPSKPRGFVQQPSRASSPLCSRRRKASFSNDANDSYEPPLLATMYRAFSRSGGATGWLGMDWT